MKTFFAWLIKTILFWITTAPVIVLSQQSVDLSAYSIITVVADFQDKKGNPVKPDSTPVCFAQDISVVSTSIVHATTSSTCTIKWLKEGTTDVVIAVGTKNNKVIVKTKPAELETIKLTIGQEMPDIAEVTGTIKIALMSSDDAGVAKAMIRLDGNLLAEMESPNFEHSLDTSTLTKGAHIIDGEAQDAAGNIGKSQPVFMMVN